jgi:hypothetical protein
MILLRLSATKRKSSGERGHPCRRPRSSLKKGEAAPLMRRAKDVVVIQFITQGDKGVAETQVNQKKPDVKPTDSVKGF